MQKVDMGLSMVMELGNEATVDAAVSGLRKNVVSAKGTKDGRQASARAGHEFMDGHSGPSNADELGKGVAHEPYLVEA